jgi:hypothetical protein
MCAAMLPISAGTDDCRVTHAVPTHTAGALLRESEAGRMVESQKQARDLTDAAPVSGADRDR